MPNHGVPSLTWEGARDGELGPPLREQATQEASLWPVTTYCRLEQMCSEEQDTHCVQSSDSHVFQGTRPVWGEEPGAPSWSWRRGRVWGHREGRV